MYVHIPSLGIHLPESSEKVVENTLVFASFDLLPTEQIYEKLELELTEEEEPSKKFVDTGYESKNFVTNAGSLFIFFMLFMLLLTLLIICFPCARICHCCKRPYKRI